MRLERLASTHMFKEMGQDSLSSTSHKKTFNGSDLSFVSGAAVAFNGSKLFASINVDKIPFFGGESIESSLQACEST